ncbi:RdRp [Sclerotinia sclerotiorum mycoreovirus 4]|uniref:RdRp n=1 Tax=Sclerotinia sclerotiorum mycoreovirus 4 TaxID=1840528 RepID=UPI0007C1D9ED|nr:RdRp [Sclerotinia sclerotiorum mycoreovirus 4]ANC52159.1 RdRp [Sclerotinia sclerotiorum mycoreovirus 4]
METTYAHHLPDSLLNTHFPPDQLEQKILWFQSVVDGNLAVDVNDPNGPSSYLPFQFLFRASQDYLHSFILSLPPSPLSSCGADCTCTRHFIPLPVPPPIPIHAFIAPPIPSTAKYVWERDTNRMSVAPGSDVYLDNFDVVSLFKMSASIKSEATPQQRKVHGMRVYFQQSIKLRALGLVQSTFLTLLSYRCTTCVNKGFRDHICFTTSPLYEWMYNICKSYPCFPFFFSRDGIQPGLVESLSSQLPLMWVQVLELMNQVSLDNISDVASSYCGHAWSDRASIGLFGQMFPRRKIVEKIKNHAIDINTIYRFEGLNLNISGVSNATVSEEYRRSFSGETDFDGPVAKLLYDHYISTPASSDESARWRDIVLNYFYGAMLYVTGPVVLSLEQSGMGLMGTTHLQAAPKEQVLIDGQWVTISNHWANPFVTKYVELMRREMSTVELNLANLESRFFESQTTNSAGNTREALDELRREYVEEYPGVEGQLLAKMSQVRAIDTIRRVSDTFTDDARFLEGMRRNAMAGSRTQQQRRRRIIQMVLTEDQVGAWVVLEMEKETYERLGHTSSGKNVGDIRDMINSLNATALPGLTISDDVAGMDATTQKMQEMLNLEPVIYGYRPEIRGYPKFFLGSRDGIPESCRRTFTTRILDVRGIEERRFEKQYNMPQVVIIYSLYASHGVTILRDGYFSDAVRTSTTVFRSGKFSTSSQHTTIGSGVLESLKRDLANGYVAPYHNAPDRPLLRKYGRQLSQISSVLGDDLQLKGVCSGITQLSVINAICFELCEEFEYRMNMLGFICERFMSEVMCEFLKQRAYGNAPHMFPDRLIAFSSERGDGVGAVCPTQYKNMAAIIGEWNSRSRNIAHTANTLRCLAIACSGYSFRTTAKGVIHRAVRGRSGYKSARVTTDWSTKDPGIYAFDGCTIVITRVKEMTKVAKLAAFNDVRAVTIILAPFWATTPHLGCPFPMLTSSSGAFPPSGPYTMPTTSMMTHWGTVISRHAFSQDNLEAAWNEVQQSFATQGTSANHFNPGSMFDVLGYTSTKAKLPEDYDVAVLLRWGVVHGLRISNIMPDMVQQREKLKIPTVEHWKRSADAMLDKRRVDLARVGNSELLAYGIKLPRELFYPNRGTMKVEKSMFTLKVTGGEFGESCVSSLEACIAVSRTPIRHFTDVHEFLLASEVRYVSTQTRFELPTSFVETGYGHVCPPRSLQSHVLSVVGLPRMSMNDGSLFRGSVHEDKKLPGDARTYVAVYRQASRVGKRAVDALQHAMGFSPKEMQELEKTATSDLSGVEWFSFAYLPRNTFLFSSDYRRVEEMCSSFNTVRHLKHADILSWYGTALMFPEKYLTGFGWSAIGSGRRGVRHVRL